MEKFSHQDIEDYYDQTEVHYRMWWDMENSLGLHYGVWGEKTKNLPEAINNLNMTLCDLGDIPKNSRVLDAGCGVGGSSFFLAEKLGCRTTGVTLSQKQVNNAIGFAKKKGLENQCDFLKCSYTDTPFEDHSIDVCWAIESVGSADNKEDFFKEMQRILKPGGKILMADTFKPYAFPVEENKQLKIMLNAWAISDIFSIDEAIEMAKKFGFKTVVKRDVSNQVKKSVKKFYLAGLAGMVGTKLYNLFKNASRFSKIHYKSGIAQKKAFDKGDWKYVLFVFEKE